MGTMDSRTLDYMTPRQATFDWRPLLRWFVLGPLTGAGVGFAQTTAALMCWIWHGQPDFYFRGWSGVEVHYLFSTVGNGIIGIAYGIVLWMFERLTGRRVRLWATIPCVILFEFIVAAVVVEDTFRQKKIGGLLSPELITVGFGLLVSTAMARRAP